MLRLPLRERVIDLEVPEHDVARGRALRKATPRSALAELSPSPRSATEILIAQDADRLPELVPLRYARMLADPFSFYRASAAVMAADLAAGPSSGIQVVCCGDAHVSNFGIYAAPDRELVFDLNDFDEAAFAPWEWDVKRLITSAIVGTPGWLSRKRGSRLRPSRREGVPRRVGRDFAVGPAGSLLRAVPTGALPHTYAQKV